MHFFRETCDSNYCQKVTVLRFLCVEWSVKIQTECIKIIFSSWRWIHFRVFFFRKKNNMTPQKKWKMLKLHEKLKGVIKPRYFLFKHNLQLLNFWYYLLSLFIVDWVKLQSCKLMFVTLPPELQVFKFQRRSFGVKGFTFWKFLFI